MMIQQTMIYYGVYQNGRLIDLIVDNLSVGHGRTNVTSSRQLKIPVNQETKIRLFVWHSNLIPAAKSREKIYRNKKSTFRLLGMPRAPSPTQFVVRSIPYSSHHAVNRLPQGQGSALPLSPNI